MCTDEHESLETSLPRAIYHMAVQLYTNLLTWFVMITILHRPALVMTPNAYICSSHVKGSDNNERSGKRVNFFDEIPLIEQQDAFALP
jgi:hypothetical protein